MAFSVRRVDYYYTTVNQEPAEAYDLLSQLARLGVNLVAINAVPFGPDTTQLTLFPEDSNQMADAAKKAGLHLNGPHGAILVQGDDEMGALATVHARLRSARVGVFASSGVTDGRGFFGYVIYLQPGDAEKAAAALKP
jgi:hypothetical protein